MINKQNILEACRELIMRRMHTAEQAMKAAQESSNSEEKSSAGDKYETARTMGQLARDMNARQLVQAQKELAELNKIDLQATSHIKSGSLIETDAGLYFIAIGLGVVKMGQKSIIVLSPGSPLAVQMLGKQPGDQYTFNQKQFQILGVS